MCSINTERDEKLLYKLIKIQKKQYVTSTHQLTNGIVYLLRYKGWCIGMCSTQDMAYEAIRHWHLPTLERCWKERRQQKGSNKRAFR